jgi:3-hydroxyacyl-[acyl-carrier-protein] dehydratase
MELPLKAEILIPHRKPMQLIDSLTEYNGKSAAASARFTADSMFAIDGKGTIERMALIELIAQTYAAAKSYEDMLEGKTNPKGYLVGISQAIFNGDAYINQSLIVRISSKDFFDSFYVACGEVWYRDILLLEATLKIWLDLGDSPKT